MRITNNMLMNNMMTNIGNNMTKMNKYQSQLATGKKIQVPSDDPIVAARALKYRTDVSEVDQYSRNLKDAASWMNITESTLNSLGDVLQRTRELTVQAANGSNSTDDTQQIEKEVDQLKTQAIHLANTTYAGRFVFSGYKTDKKLMNDDGTFATSVNNSENIKYEIGIGDDISINVPGGDLFNNGNNSVGDTVGSLAGNNGISFPLIIAPGNEKLGITVDGESVTANIPADTYNDAATLAVALQSEINSKTVKVADISVVAVGNNLKFTSGSQGPKSSISIDNTTNAVTDLGLANLPLAPTNSPGVAGQIGSLMSDFDSLTAALNLGDHAKISELIGNLDIDMNNLLRVRADVGARQNRLDLTSNRLDNDTLNFTKLMSENEDVDMSETIMNLQNEENVYKASLAGGAKIIQPTLVDFLR
jgi:flagellar hook-associated protein 3 FlgL